VKIKRFSGNKSPAIICSDSVFSIFIHCNVSSNGCEESMPLSRANEDSDSDPFSEHSLTIRRRCLPGQPPASLTVFKMSLSIVLSFILGAAMFTAFIAQINQRKMDSGLDRQCAMRTSHYCKLFQSKAPIFSQLSRAATGEDQDEQNICDC
jgi:hypothetical protein